MKWDDGLIGPARDIAAADGASLRVQAGPGTGKTFALQRRVMRALESGVPAKSILVVTFTRVAAADLKQSLISLGIDGCEEVNACTLHAFCFGVLNREDVFKMLDRVPRSLIRVEKQGWMQYEFDPMLADLDNDKEFGDKRERQKRIRAFEAAWAKTQRDDVTPASDPVDRAFEEELVSWLRFHRAIIIGELVPITLRYLRQNPLDDALSRYRYVIVDEYQDLNKAEQLLTDLLAAKGQLTIVGDADQSIYSFKHANPEGIVDFATRHTSLIDKSLTECRRCPTEVVNAANELIAHNKNRFTTEFLQPFPTNPPGNIINVQWPTMPDEVKGITTYVSHLLDQTAPDGTRLYDPKDILVLCPSRDIAYMLRDELLNSNVLAHSFYHEEALEDDDAKLAFCTLNLFIDPEDRVSLRYWLGFGSGTWLAKQYAILRNICEKENKPPRLVLDEVIVSNRKIPGIAKLVSRYRALSDKIRALYEVDSEGVLNGLFPEGPAWARAFRDLIDAIRESDPEANIKTIFEALRDYITQPEVPSDPDFVRIMSLHKSKGLTSKVVILCGAVDGSIPRYDDKLKPDEAKEKLEEQRRLFYVAMTRPKELLVISHYRGIAKHLLYRVGAVLNSRGHSFPSQFIEDAGRTIPHAIAGQEWLDAL